MIFVYFRTPEQFQFFVPSLHLILCNSSVYQNSGEIILGFFLWGVGLEGKPAFALGLYELMQLLTPQDGFKLLTGWGAVCDHLTGNLKENLQFQSLKFFAKDVGKNHDGSWDARWSFWLPALGSFWILLS